MVAWIILYVVVSLLPLAYVIVEHRGWLRGFNDCKDIHR